MLKKDEIERYLQKIDAAETYVKSLWGILNDEVCDNLFKNISMSVDLLRELCEDEDEWLDWFIYETHFGATPLIAKIDNKEYLVDSFESFWILFMDLKRKS